MHNHKAKSQLLTIIEQELYVIIKHSYTIMQHKTRTKHKNIYCGYSYNNKLTTLENQSDPEIDTPFTMPKDLYLDHKPAYTHSIASQ